MNRDDGPESRAVLTAVAQNALAKIDVGGVLALSGPQGSGKSTVSRRVASAPDAGVALLSLDDFYLPKTKRAQLAAEVSPLFETRGPPGTHDLGLLRRTIDALRTAVSDTATPIPVFDKVSDDRLPSSEWSIYRGRPKKILVEGWCLGALTPPDFLSAPPLNDVERSDSGKAWRSYQAAQLSGAYADLWSVFDAFLHIEAPDFATVTAWRAEQERDNQKTDDLALDRIAWVNRFVQHFERLTIAMAEGYRQPGEVVRLNRDRTVAETR
jgi:D-glycerate 3-kinase